MEDKKAFGFYTERQLLRDKRILYLIGDVDNSECADFIVDMEILRALSKKPITIIISSPGGDVEYGLGCIRAIRRAQKDGIKVIGQVYGHAMSMAFLILECCDKRVMGKGCCLMAHGVTTMMHGDIKNLEAEQKLLGDAREYFAGYLAERTKNTEFGLEYWQDLLKDNTPQFFNSQESLGMDLIDEVEE